MERRGEDLLKKAVSSSVSIKSTNHLHHQPTDLLLAVLKEMPLTGPVSNDQRIKNTIFRTEDLVGILGHVELDRRVLLVEEMRQPSVCTIRELKRTIWQMRGEDVDVRWKDYRRWRSAPRRCWRRSIVRVRLCQSHIRQAISADSQWK
jgi:hypothetical protein